MSISKEIAGRISALIAEGFPLSEAGKQGYAFTFEESQKAEGWLTSAVHLVEMVVRNSNDAYRRKSDSILASTQKDRGEGRLRRSNETSQYEVGSMIGVLESLARDIDAGMIDSISDHIRAAVFDDFLDHAVAYHRSGRKESGVIAGVVFEDAMRRIAEKHGAGDASVDAMISNLVKGGILTDAKAKRARSAAVVRTKATHAKWDEFDLADVQACIEFTREMIAANLD